MTQRQFSVTSGTPLQDCEDALDRQLYYYPQVPKLQRPPAAQLYTKRMPEGQTIEGTRVQSPISTTSESSYLSYSKRHTPSPEAQWPSPTLERTLVSSGQRYPLQPQQRQGAGLARTEHGHKRSGMAGSYSPALAYTYERRHIREDDNEEEDEDHALWVLFWLSCLDPLHSLASCLFTIAATLALVLASPVRLLRRKSSFGDQAIRILAPMFKNHLDMMYAASSKRAFEWDFRPWILIFMHLVSPVISVGVAIASWVTAAFWVFTSIMGNPDGTERRDDGCDAVLAVRNWWESCLLNAVISEKHPTRSVV